MNFNKQTYEFVMDSIEEYITFKDGTLKNYDTWNIVVNLPIEKLIKVRPDDKQEIMFITKTLKEMKYITFSDGDYSVIHSITSKGMELLFKRHYGVNLD